MATIRKRKSGTYEIKVSCGYDINGKQVLQFRHWKPPEGMSKRQIEKELMRQAVLFEEECRKGMITASIKFQTFAEQWFKEYAIINLRPTSYERMRQTTQRVYPALGHMKLDKISARHIQAFISDLCINGKNQRNGKPLSRKTIVHHLNFISDVFSYAVKMDMLSDNPCRRVTVPKGESKEKEIYTIDEVRQIFEKLESETLKWKLYIMLAIYSGFRRSEMLGLEWKDVDFQNSIIFVKRTSQYTKDKGIYTDTTKTKRSKRVSKFPPLIMDLLKKFRIEQRTEAERIGSKWIECDRLFVKWNGEPMNPQTPYGWFREFCKNNGFRFCDIHSLRHLHASLLIFEGVDVVAVSADMGHSVVGTTLNLYSHMFQEARVRNCDAITNALSFNKVPETPADEGTDEAEIVTEETELSL